MLEKSAERNLYSELVCSAIATYIQATDKRFDLIVCADVFIDIGDLERIFFGVKKRSIQEAASVFQSSIPIGKTLS